MGQSILCLTMFSLGPDVCDNDIRNHVAVLQVHQQLLFDIA
jgi:hypothetical protein